MTVAAVILAARPESALADADGQAAVRRIADAAWAGGALPIVIVAADPDGAIAAALAGTSTTLAEPAPGLNAEAAAQIARGIEVATALVSGVDAALVWPARMAWVGPETVTSLIEAHGVDRETVLRPAYDGEAGWPALVPIAHAAALGTGGDRMPDELLAELDRAGVRTRTVDLGDPGTTHDVSTPRGELPEYAGPSEPAAPHSHEWGAALADLPEESPLAGPSLAPYGQAVADDPDQPG